VSDSNPYDDGTADAGDAPNIYDTLDAAPPVKAAPERREDKQSVSGAAQAGASGLNAGIADVAGLPVDTLRNATELGKAAAGTAYGLATSKDTTPANETLADDGRSTRTTHGLYHYIDPATGSDTFSKNPPPAGAKPYTHTQVTVPSFLQPGHDKEDIGGSESIKNAMRKMGDDMVDTQEQTPMNRVIHAGAEAAPNAVFVPEAPIGGLLSTVGGGASRQAAAEAGAGPVGQTIAGLAGGMAPAVGAGLAATTRGAVRGGDAGRQAMEARLADAKASNTNLSAGQASGNPALQYAEGTISKIWGGHPIVKNAENQTGTMGSRVNDIVDNLSGGQPANPTSAGNAIIKGIGDEKTPNSALGRMHQAESDAYGKLDDLVNPSTPINMDGTMKALDALATPTAGAENTTGALTSSKISAMRDNLRADLEASQAPGGAAQKGVYTAGGNPPKLPAGSLPYGSVRALRSAVGNSIDWGFAPSDPGTNSGLKRVWGALSGDLKDGASSVSPEAAKAAETANSLYAANTARRESLAPYIDKAGGPEAVFQAATNGTKQGATKIGSVMDAIGPDHQNLVRATVLSRLGKAVPSSQTASGEEFSPNTFLTNWSKMDPNAKDALFGKSGASGDLRANLDSLSNTASAIRSGTKLQNPSGTARSVGHIGGLAAAWEGIQQAVAGHPGTLAGTVGGVTVNHLLARALTNPTTVRWLAKQTKAPVSTLPNAVKQLSNTDDSDAKDLAEYLQSNDRQARASGGKVDHEALVERLIKRWKSAKKETDETTKPLLNVPDAAIVKALDIAQESI
jgi:hypothetical protein